MTISSSFDSAVYQPWKNEYIAYGAINEGIKIRCDSEHWTERDEADFKSTIRLEAMKVDMFIHRKQREIESRIKHVEHLLLLYAQEEQKHEMIQESIEKITKDIHMLGQFIRTNVKGLQHLVYSHDRLTGKNKNGFLSDVLRTRSLDNQRLDFLIVSSGHLLNRCKIGRRRNEIKEEKKLYHGKFWIHPDNMTEVQATLLLNLPHQSSKKAVTSIYLDNDRFEKYSSQLQLDDQSETIRCYWYDSLENNLEVYIEKETFIKDNDCGEYKREHILINKQHVYHFFNLEYSADDYAQDLRGQNCAQGYIDKCYNIAKSIQDSIRSQKLHPTFRMYHHYLEYQPSHASISVMLESDITYIREDAYYNYLQHRHEYGVKLNEALIADLSNDGMYSLPISILDITIADSDIPSWLNNLIRSNLIYEVPRFSLFTQGTYVFWDSILPIAPWWSTQLDSELSNNSSNNDMNHWTNHRRLYDQNEYHIGYLQSEIGKQIPFIQFNPNHDEYTVHIENDSYHDPEKNMSDVYPASSTEWAGGKLSFEDKQQSYSFLDFYYGGRHSSQAYLLNTVNSMETINKPKKKKKKKMPGDRIEPKVFFANERTFIHWLQFAAFILTAAVTLLNFGDHISVVSGSVFFGVSFIIGIYAFFRDRFRAHQISTAPHLRYDDLYGPFGLCCLLLGAMLVNFVLRWQHPPVTDTYLGINNSTDEQT